MALREFLPQSVRYIGCDHSSREPGTVLVDLNAEPLPAFDVRNAWYIGLPHPTRRCDIY